MRHEEVSEMEWKDPNCEIPSPLNFSGDQKVGDGGSPTPGQSERRGSVRSPKLNRFWLLGGCLLLAGAGNHYIKNSLRNRKEGLRIAFEQPS